MKKDILKIIKKQPKDHIYYSTVVGPAIAEYQGGSFPIRITPTNRCLRNSNNVIYDLDKYGHMIPGGLCTLFPSEFNRDWDDINNNIKFYTYQPVLVRDSLDAIWIPDLFSYQYPNSPYPYKCIGGVSVYCIPLDGNENIKWTKLMNNENKKG